MRRIINVIVLVLGLCFGLLAQAADSGNSQEAESLLGRGAELGFV